MNDSRSRHEIIVDARTGRFIGEREVITKGAGGLKAGTVVAYTSVSTAVVNSIGTRPTR